MEETFKRIGFDETVNKVNLSKEVSSQEEECSKSTQEILK